MNNKEIKALMNCNDILTKECAKLRNENEELKKRLLTIVQHCLCGYAQNTSHNSSYETTQSKITLSKSAKADFS